MGIIPEPYDMTKKEDVERWFREMDGYFRVTCTDRLDGQKYDFLHQGTDFEGRKFALEAFEQLKQMQILKELSPQIVEQEFQKIKAQCQGFDIEILEKYRDGLIARMKEDGRTKSTIDRASDTSQASAN